MVVEYACIDAYPHDRLAPARTYWTTDRRTIELTYPHLTRLRRIGSDGQVVACGQGQLIAATRAYYSDRVGTRHRHRLAPT